MHNHIYGSLAGKPSTGALLPSALPSGRKALATVLEDTVIRFFDRVLAWHEEARSRHDLAQLDDRMLSDIGISRATAEQKASVPFWH